MDMFSYRVVKAVGAYLCALGGADALVFGGGIGENNQLVRGRVGEALRWCGLEMDAEKNRTVVERRRQAFKRQIRSPGPCRCQRRRPADRARVQSSPGCSFRPIARTIALPVPKETQYGVI